MKEKIFPTVFDGFIPGNLDNLRKDLRNHYARQWQLIGQRHPVEELLDQYDKAHPGLNAYQLKAAQYKIRFSLLQCRRMAPQAE